MFNVNDRTRKITSRVAVALLLCFVIAIGLYWAKDWIPGLGRGESVRAAVQSAGPRMATASGDCVNSADIGTVAWTNPGNAFSDNSTDATVSVDGTTSNYLKCTNFGFTTTMIPTGSTILGIVVGIERSSSQNPSNFFSGDAAVRLVKNGTIGTTDRSTTNAYTTTMTLDDHGGSSDLWGDTWTVTDVTSSTFGTAFSTSKNTSSGPAHTVSVDFIQITIYFNPPPPTLTQRHYIFEQDDGANVNSNTSRGSADTALTNVKKGERIIVRFQVDNTGSGSFSGGQFKLRYDKNDSSWQNVNGKTEISTGFGLSGSSGDAITSSKAGSCTGGTTFSNGIWTEGGSVSSPVTMANAKCTEVAFVIDTRYAVAGTTYRLSLIDAVDDEELDTYSVYPTLTVVSDSNDLSRFSKDVQLKLANCTNSEWGCEDVQSGASLSVRDNSLAFDSGGNPWMSMYDNWSSELWAARYVGSGGTGCATGVTEWSCGLVDGNTTSSKGEYNSIIFDPAGNAWIAYYARGTGDLRVAQYVGSGGTGCEGGVTAWTCTAVDTANDVGSFTSMAMDPSAGPTITYFNETSTNLRWAKYVGSGGTGCASSAWTCVVLDSTAQHGRYGSLKFDNAGTAWVSYANQSDNSVWIAKYVGSGGTGCGGSGSTEWSCSQVDVNGVNNLGRNTSLAIDASNNPWISYYDITALDLWVAKYVATGGSGCGSGTTAWTCTKIDATGDVGGYNSVEIDASDNAWISYYDATNTALKLARYVGSGGSGCAGGSSAWTCQTIDNTATVGQYTSLNFDPSNAAWISYVDATSGTNLKVRTAKMHVPQTVSRSLRYPLDGQGYTNTSADDTNFDAMAAGTNSPIFQFTTRHTTNTDPIQPTWIGKSDVAASTDNIKMQVYRFGATNVWVDLATETSCTANNDCTITPTAISTNLSDYYQTDGGKYVLHVRIYQSAGNSKTLQTDCYSSGSGCSAAPTAPTMDQKLGRGNWWLNGVRQFLNLD